MFEMNDLELEKALKMLEVQEEERKRKDTGPSINWTGLNTGEKVVRFLTKKLPQFRTSSKDAKYVWTSRILTLEGRYKRIIWPTLKQENGIPKVNPDFILYKALLTIKKEIPTSPILSNKREGRKFGEHLLPRLRVVSNIFDREKEKVTILCEKTWVSDENIEYCLDMGITTMLLDQILKEVLTYRKTLDIDIYINRYVEGNKVLYSLRDFQEEKKPAFFLKYGKKENPPVSEKDLYDIDDLTKETTENDLKDFEHIIELYNRISKKEKVNEDLEYLKSKYNIF